MSQSSLISVSIPASAEKDLLAYATGKKGKKKEVRQLLRPFIEALGVASKEHLAPYRQSIIAVIANIELEDRVFQVLGRSNTTGVTSFTERQIFFATNIHELNAFEMAIRKSAQKKMSEEWNYLLGLWFNTVSMTSLLVLMFGPVFTQIECFFTGVPQRLGQNNRRLLVAGEK